MACGRQTEEMCLENPPCFPALCSGWGCGVAVKATINDGIVSVSAESGVVFPAGDLRKEKSMIIIRGLQLLFAAGL